MMTKKRVERLLTERVKRLAGSLAHRATRMTREEEEAAIMKAVRADDERTKDTERKRR